MKTRYYCDICGKEFDDFQECLNHEADDHVNPSAYESAKTINFSIPGDNVQDCRYPIIVSVPMADGNVLAYRYDYDATVDLQKQQLKKEVLPDAS